MKHAPSALRLGAKHREKLAKAQRDEQHRRDIEAKCLMMQAARRQDERLRAAQQRWESHGIVVRESTPAVADSWVKRVFR
jgi:hypothetical protein